MADCARHVVLAENILAAMKRDRRPFSVGELQRQFDESFATINSILCRSGFAEQESSRKWVLMCHVPGAK